MDHALAMLLWVIIGVSVAIAFYRRSQRRDEEDRRRNRAMLARETTGELKTPCQHCGQNISFHRSFLNEIVTCPHCNIQTRLVAVEPPYIPPPVVVPPPEPEDIGWAQFMILCGLGAMIYFAAFFEIGNGNVANLDLLNQRLCGVICSSTVTLLGMLMIISYRLRPHQR